MTLSCISGCGPPSAVLLLPPLHPRVADQADGQVELALVEHLALAQPGPAHDELEGAHVPRGGEQLRAGRPRAPRACGASRRVGRTRRRVVGGGHAHQCDGLRATLPHRLSTHRASGSASPREAVPAPAGRLEQPVLDERGEAAVDLAGIRPGRLERRPRPAGRGCRAAAGARPRAPAGRCRATPGRGAAGRRGPAGRRRPRRTGRAPGTARTAGSGPGTRGRRAP